MLRGGVPLLLKALFFAKEYAGFQSDPGFKGLIAREMHWGSEFRPQGSTFRVRAYSRPRGAPA